MLRNRNVILVLTLAIPVWAVGLIQTATLRRELSERCPNLGVFERYEALRPGLEGSSRAFIVAARKQGKLRHFRAQYALAPQVIWLRYSASDLAEDSLDDATVILDASSPSELAENLDSISSEAARRGLEISSWEVERLLTVIKLSRD